LCDADEESSSDMLSEELNIDYDDEFNLESEGVTVSEELSNEISESESDTCCCVLLPSEAIGPTKRQESTWGDKTYREKISENICPWYKYCNR
jgi:hypothetical protein